MVTNYLDPANIISLIDLTSLNADDNETSILALCKKATTPFGNVAAICIYPQFLPIAVKALKNTAIKIATVVNFPGGDFAMQDTLDKINIAISDGANEIDMVFPYHDYINGEKNKAIDYVKQAKELCKNQAALKIIIESGELKSFDLIKAITNDAISSGADFIKTSTGKTKQGATLEAANTILTTIKESNRPVGFKVSGGVSTVPESLKYIQLSNEIMGKQWMNPTVFRIGTSKLLDEIMRISQRPK